MLKIVLIEDEPLALEQLSELVKQWDNNASIEGCIDSLEDGFNYFQSNDWPDIIVSDIQLSDGLSLDLFKKGVPNHCKIIFTTAYDQYAIDAFKIHAQDYLLKPIDSTSLFNALDKVKLDLKNIQSIDYTILAEMVAQKLKVKSKTFLLRFNNQLIEIDSNEIAFFHLHDRLNLIHTFDGRKLPIDDSLDKLEKEVNSSDFFRANRKCLINHKAIDKIKSYSTSKLLLECKPPFPDGEVVISKEKSPLFKKWLLERKLK